MVRVTFEIDPAGLRTVTDSHLAALWHVSQANPAPHGDRDACALAGAVTAEILRRWLAETPPDLYAHQAADHALLRLMAGRTAAACGDTEPAAAGREPA
ncbi:MAG: hypothetical protein L6Q75_20310 [Burkholderiaceae bacterium]|nr:hypothetical protein [Burkholderiaceae bacterium]